MIFDFNPYLKQFNYLTLRVFHQSWLILLFFAFYYSTIYYSPRSTFAFSLKICQFLNQEFGDYYPEQKIDYCHFAKMIHQHFSITFSHFLIFYILQSLHLDFLQMITFVILISLISLIRFLIIFHCKHFHFTRISIINPNQFI